MTERRHNPRAMWLLVTLLCGLAGVLAWRGPLLWSVVKGRGPFRTTVQDRLEEFGGRADPLWRARFEARGLKYPPPSLLLVTWKRERALEVYARAEADAAWVFVHRFDVLAASGGPGPKLREGDRQVPEGYYRLAGLNPNSSYHLSMKVDYPTTFDREQAARQGREDLGGDIFIHGRAASIGCVAIGDPGIEELFVLVARAGWEEVEVWMSPWDWRRKEAPREVPGAPAFMTPVYERLREDAAGLGR